MIAEHRDYLVALIVASCLHAAVLAGVSLPERSTPSPGPRVLRFDVAAAAPEKARAAAEAPAAADLPTPARERRRPETAPPPVPVAAPDRNEVTESARAEPEPIAASPPSAQVREERVAAPEAQRHPAPPAEASRVPDAPSKEPRPVEPPAQLAPAAEPEVASLTAPSAPAAAREGVEQRAREAAASYEQALAAWLERHKYYPSVARRRGLEGAGLLRIRIDRAGNVRERSVERETGSRLLDDAALDMVRRADPFPAMPDPLPGSHFEFVVPIEYRQID